MARKGSHKVRTGCFTCKKRKVKCDEGKPICDRCVNTGRTCDGYAPPPPGHYSWAELLGKKAILPAITPRRNTQDGRAFDFYHHVVAPALSRFPGDEFWTRMVSQASMQEPAVRHAVLSISTVYELVDDTPSEKMLMNPKGRYAMVQYNHALQHLAGVQDESVVLFSCILFICLEILRDNKMGALTHVTHGVRVFNNCLQRKSAWAADYLRPIFNRLTSCPFFFGATEKALPILYGVEGLRVSGHQENYEVARYRLDLLTASSIRFVRKYEAAGPDRPKDTPDYTDFEEQQAALVSALDDWLANYDILEATAPRPSGTPTPFLLMRMIYIVLKIWVLVCRETDEMAYDEHMDSFAEVVDLARQAAEAESEKQKSTSDPTPRSKFVLDMGFIPVLYFVITKCRKLSLRLAALRYLPLLAPERENLWNATTMYAVAKKIVEMEHGPLDADGQAVATSEGGHPDHDLAEPRITIATCVDATPLLVNAGGSSPDRANTHLLSLSPKPPSRVRVKDVLVLSERDFGDGATSVPAYPHKPGATLSFIVGAQENSKRVYASLEDSANTEDGSLGIPKPPYSQRVRFVSDLKPFCECPFHLSSLRPMIAGARNEAPSWGEEPGFLSG